MGYKEVDFEPCPFLKHSFLQTFCASLDLGIFKPRSERRLIPVSHGDKIALEVTTPKSWRKGDLTVFCIHGLGGSHESSYILRLVNSLTPLGVRCIRYNTRGCGSGKGFAKHIYYGFNTEDVLECMKVLKQETPESPIVLIGFSLGGNTVLKLAGELGDAGKDFLEKVIAITPPVDLAATEAHFGDSLNGLYEKAFYSYVKEMICEHQEMFEDIPRVNLPGSLKMRELDTIYTIPHLGKYTDVEEYYQKNSSIHYIQGICVDCKILFAQDDPIVAHDALDQHELASHIEVYKTKYGGHMGYLGHPFQPRGFFWLISLLVDWILGA